MLWLTSVIICSLLFAQVHCQCETIATRGGTRNPEECVFPFRYNGKTYRECTIDQDPDGRRWCSVQVDINGNHVTNRRKWGHCNGRKCPTTGTRTTCITNGSGKAPAGSLCVFPFKFRSRTFHSCTREFDSRNRPWCSTKIDSRGKHVLGNWGHCQCVGLPEPPIIPPSISPPPPTPPIPLPPTPTIAPPPPTPIPKPLDRGDFLPRYGSRYCSDRSRFVPQIVNGTPASINEFKFAAAIGFQMSGSRIVYGCGGSLINRWYVLSAAHCFNDPLRFRAVQVRLGELDFKTDPDCIGSNCAPTHQSVSCST